MSRNRKEIFDQLNYKYLLSATLCHTETFIAQTSIRMREILFRHVGKYFFHKQVFKTHNMRHNSETKVSSL